jgi:hypothetical protein
MACKTAQIIARGPHIWLVQVCMPAVTRLPKNPALRLAATAGFSDASLSRFRCPESEDFRSPGRGRHGFAAAAS